MKFIDFLGGKKPRPNGSQQDANDDVSADQARHEETQAKVAEVRQEANLAIQEIRQIERIARSRQ